jgi:anti-anti-sigma factor
MNIKKAQVDDRAVFTLSGKLDANTAATLEEAIITALDEHSSNIDLDFAEISFISSWGLRALLVGAKEAKEQGGELRLKNVSPKIRSVLKSTGFLNILTIV